MKPTFSRHSTYAAKTTNDSKDINIYLADEYVDPIDEVHWDATTKPFEYIIKQQFYEVFPNPNGATTLYTDCNITSSKIITADNITTMRSDLNLVTNNVDVISYDVNEMNTVMESLKGRVSRTEQVTQKTKQKLPWDPHFFDSYLDLFLLCQFTDK